jgi:hypothetical protein
VGKFGSFYEFTQLAQYVPLKVLVHEESQIMGTDISTGVLTTPTSTSFLAPQKGHTSEGS